MQRIRLDKIQNYVGEHILVISSESGVRFAGQCSSFPYGTSRTERYFVELVGKGRFGPLMPDDEIYNAPLIG
jgi:hypothetical protein